MNETNEPEQEEVMEEDVVEEQPEPRSSVGFHAVGRELQARLDKLEKDLNDSLF